MGFISCISSLSSSSVAMQLLRRSCYSSRQAVKQLERSLFTYVTSKAHQDSHHDNGVNATCSKADEEDGGDANDGHCLLTERFKYKSWPSEEHASFAFARIASPGNTTIDAEEFISTLKRMQLDFNLGDCELRRVFDYLDKNNDGRLSLEEFKSGRGSHPLTRTLVERLSSASVVMDPESRFPDPMFDNSVSTAEFYSAPIDNGFVGENSSIRKILDYSYHNNYSAKRQHFQDALIKSNVLLDGSGSHKPWYVLTCGPMGVGKGYVLGWMSSTGILELERISKIDPDAFKLRMPEWQLYLQNGKADVAGTMTHAESSYIAEIAQHVAMKNSMDVWVDGSLQNSAWYEVELQRIRNSYPNYRVAIISISAPDDMIENNIKRRAIETGRGIPHELQKTFSVDEIGKGVQKLTHLVDLVASVRNTPKTEKSDAKPVLRFVSMVDRSGNWDLIKELAAH